MTDWSEKQLTQTSIQDISIPVSAVQSEFTNLYNKLHPNKVPPARLLSLDPGETTGWSIYKGPVLYHGDQLETKDNMFNNVIELLDATDPTHIICEDYKVYAHKLKDHSWASLHTPQLIGAIRMLAYQRNIPVFFQMAQQAKGFCTDDKLKKWGYYKTGLRHGRDSIRHGCYFLLFNKEDWGNATENTNRF